MTDAPRLPEGIVDQFIGRRVCARCYGELAKRTLKDTRDFEVYCPTCNGDWNYTTVSRHYAERLGQKALTELDAVKTNLPDLFPNPNKGKSAEELIKELGF